MTDQQRNTLLKALSQSGVFVTSGDKDSSSSNIMSLHWGTLGSFWNKPVFVLPVRHTKFTHRLIDENRFFGVSVPYKDMRNEIIQCDHLSGHNVNKFESLNLHPKRAKDIPVYLIAGCGMYLECKVLFSAEMDPKDIDNEIAAEHYEEGNYHTLYFAEVINCYEEE